MNDESATIDVGAWLMTLVRNWWVIIGLLVLGAVVGGIVTLSAPKQYTATSSVYIGQTTDANGNAMAGLNSNSKAATQLLSSQVVLDEAAQRAGMKVSPGRLRRETTVQTPSSTVKTSTSVVNIVVISVTDTKKARATAAANALADVLVEQLSPQVDQKIALLQQQLTQGQQEMAASIADINAARKSLDAIAHQGGSAAQKAAASAPYLAIVTAANTEQQSLASSNQKTQLLLFSAKTVEQPRILHKAALPDSPSGPSTKLNVAAGALAGFVIGIVVAFVRRRLSERAAARS
jgi:capsular polysaccharide biosynthesis protein